MEAQTDRRALDVHRIPLDMLVRLTHEDYEEPFDADGVDVSAGGIALRADYLPEIGDRLRCRFDAPPDGAEIELDGEVVWAHDAGERSGEFGLRFAAMDVEAEEALERIIAHLGGGAAHTARARLHLESVATPIDAEVIDRDARSLTVEQELPFLRIGMGVAVEGHGPAHGRLASVDLRIEEGVPRLLLVVEDARPVESDETLRDYPSPREDTPSEPLPALHARAGALHEDVDDEDDAIERDPHDDDALDDDSLQHDALQHDAIERLEARGHLDRVEVGDDRPAHPLLAVAAERLGPAWTKTRAGAAALAVKIRPSLAALWAKTLVFTAAVVAKGGPRTKRAWAKVRAALEVLGGKVAARVLRGKAKRRTTATPPVRTAEAPRLRRQREEPASRSPRKTGRIVLISALAFAGVGTAVYALSGDDAAPEPAPLVVPQPAAPAAAAPVPESATLPIEPAPEAPAAPEPDPALEAGRLGEPTYPTLRDATQAPAPATVSAPATGTHFGASDVPNGRSRTIRMSQPVTELRGERQPDGFTVTIPGSLALEGARGIAAANPTSIDQSMILNRGDHSVLTVRFIAGQSPPYRVVARGAAIEVTIGR